MERKRDEVGTQEAAKVLGVSYGAMANWRSFGVGPKYRKIGKFVLYTKGELMRFKNDLVCPRCGQPKRLRVR